MAERHVGLGKESAYGTQAAITRWHEIESETVKLQQNHADVNTIRDAATRKVSFLNEAVRGDLVMPANYQTTIALLYAMFGSSDVSGTFDHVVPATSGVTDRPSYTLEVQRDEGGDGGTWQYLGVIFSRLVIAMGLTDILKTTATVIGQSEVVAGAAGTPAYDTFDEVVPREMAIEFDGGTVLCTSASLQIDRPATETFAIGNAVLAKIPRDAGPLSVQLTLNAYFDTFAQYTKFTNRSDVAIDLDCQAAVGANALTFAMAKTRLVEAGPGLTGRDELQAQYVARSFFNSTATSNLLITGTNDETVIDN